MIDSHISATATVGSIVAAQPGLARFFESAGIGYCCDGKRSLADACTAKGLDPATFVVLLKAAAKFSVGSPAIDADALTLTALADHIEQTHHRYLQSELPALVDKANRVAAKHGWRDARLLPVAETVRALAEDLFLRMAKEEEVLFPLVRELERTGATSGNDRSIAIQIRQSEHEHDGAGAAVARLRELTDAFTPDAQACNTHRAMLAGFATLEADLREHVHKENKVLFPRALALGGLAVA